MPTTSRIGSFAVLDLETNTIPDYNFNKASITEIAIHGFSVKEFHRANQDCKVLRVIHKLNLLFCPRAVIHLKAEEITELDNYMLEHESTLNTNAANGIVSFLKHLQQPVCLVAHNGDRFDFPVLKQALDKLQMSLPSDVLCIDTLVAIKEIDRLAKEREEEIPSSQGTEDDSVIQLPGEDSSVVIIPDSEEEEERPKGILPEEKENAITITPDVHEEEDGSPAYWKKLNETTPQRPRGTALTALRKSKRKRDAEGDTTPIENNIKSRRALFDSPKQENNTNTANQTVKYNLGSIYLRLFDESPVCAHQAEADVITLQKVMLGYGEDFVEYAEANAKPFANVKKLGTH